MAPRKCAAAELEEGSPAQRQPRQLCAAPSSGDGDGDDNDDEDNDEGMQQQSRKQEALQTAPEARLLADHSDTPAERCAIALAVLSEHPSGALFSSPVDADQASDYAEVIKEPMDFATMRDRLKTGEYVDAATFVEDARRVYRNALTYNWEPGNEIASAALEGLSLLERLLPLILDGRAARGASAWVAMGAKPAPSRENKVRGPAPRTLLSNDDHMHNLLDFVLLCGGATDSFQPSLRCSLASLIGSPLFRASGARLPPIFSVDRHRRDA